MSTSYTTIRLDCKGAIATLTINRPESLNALSRKVLEELEQALHEVAINTEIRVLLLTGEGRAFCCRSRHCRDAFTLSIRS